MRSLKDGDLLREVVFYERWSHTEVDCIRVFVICDLTALKPDLKRVKNKIT